MKKNHVVFFWAFLFCCQSPLVLAQSTQVQLQSVASDLYIPWDLEHWGGDSLLFTQRSGEILRLDMTQSKLDTLHILSNVAELQHSGLMGMALHPQWPDSQQVFVAYAFYDAQFQVLLRLEKLQYDPFQDKLIPAQVLLDSIAGAATTTGARVLCSPDGHVFLSTGDINLGTVAQDTSSLNGKILRLKLDGSIPADNPFAGSPVWSLGHRNPQGLAMSPEGKLFSCEHGASANDELNLIEKGRNYGWPEVSGSCDGEPACQTLNLVDPLKTWSPPIAPCGLAYAEEAQALSNGLLMAGLRGEALYWLQLDQDQAAVLSEETLINASIGRIRDVLVTPSGRIFVSTSNQEGANPPGAGDDQIFELFANTTPVDKRPSDRQWVKLGIEEQTLNLLHSQVFGPGSRYGVFGFDGKKITEGLIPPGLSRYSVDISMLAQAYYFVSVSGPEGRFYQKIYLSTK